MTIKEFIEAAIEGGWHINYLKQQMNYHYEFRVNPFSGKEDLWCEDDIGGKFWLDHNQMVLDLEAWKAVGKVKGWPQGYESEIAHQMIVALFRGSTLEEYITTL